MVSMESKEEDLLANAVQTKGDEADDDDEEDYEVKFGS